MIWQDPANGSNACGRTNDAIQSYLANLNKTDSSGGCIDDEVIENVLVGIYKQRVLSSKCNYYSCRG